MKVLKKYAALLLAVGMTATALVGCTNAPATSSTSSGTSSASESSTQESSQVTQIIAAFPGVPSKGADVVVTAINEKLAADGMNIAVTVTFFDDYWNKLALDTAAATTTDLAWAHASTLSGLVSKKVYQPIDDALAANGSDLLSNTPDYVLKGGQISGKQYALPRVIPMAYYNNTLDIRGDLRKKYNLPEVNSLETLEQYLEAIAANEPDMQSFSGENSQSLYPVYADYFFPIGDNGIHPVYFDPADGTVKSFLDSDAFGQICDIKKAWRDKGWLKTGANDPLSADELFDTGMTAAVPSNVMRASERAETMAKTIPGVEIETVLLTTNKKIFVAGDNMLAVPSTSKNVNEAIAFVNWFKKDQANYDLWSYGIEGVNYSLKDNAIDTSAVDANNQYSMNTWMWNDISLARFSASYPAQNIEMLKTWDENAEVTKFVGFAMDTSAVSAEVSQLQTVADEYTKNLGLGVSEFAAVRDELTNQLKAAGIEKVIAEAQTQIDAYIGA